MKVAFLFYFLYSSIISHMHIKLKTLLIYSKISCEFIFEEFDEFLNSVKNRLENEEMFDANEYFSDMGKM